MTTHELKSWPQFFEPIADGNRTSDIRSKTDRYFAIGDHMILKEFDPFGGGFTGREQEVEITHIISNETPCALSSAVLERDYCVLSIRKIEE